MQLKQILNQFTFKKNLIIKIFVVIKPKLVKTNKMAQWCLQSNTTERILTWSPTQTNRNWDNQKRGLIFNW